MFDGVASTQRGQLERIALEKIQRCHTLDQPKCVVTVGCEATDAVGTTPLVVDRKRPFDAILNKSKKIAPDQIEVVWGRKIFAGAAAGVETSLDGDNTLVVDPVANGTLLYGENPHDRLRVRDDALPQIVDGTGVQVSYYLGHPTEAALPTLSVFSNWAAYVNGVALPTKTYSVALHIVGLSTI